MKRSRQHARAAAAKPGIFGGLVVIVFQTYRTNPSDFEGTIRMGVAQGATSIELWQDYRGFPEVANAKLKHWAELVEANKTP